MSVSKLSIDEDILAFISNTNNKIPPGNIRKDDDIDDDNDAMIVSSDVIDEDMFHDVTTMARGGMISQDEIPRVCDDSPIDSPSDMMLNSESISNSSQASYSSYLLLSMPALATKAENRHQRGLLDYDPISVSKSSRLSNGVGKLDMSKLENLEAFMSKIYQSDLEKKRHLDTKLSKLRCFIESEGSNVCPRINRRSSVEGKVPAMNMTDFVSQSGTFATIQTSESSIAAMEATESSPAPSTRLSLKVVTLGEHRIPAPSSNSNNNRSVSSNASSIATEGDSKLLESIKARPLNSQVISQSTKETSAVAMQSPSEVYRNGPTRSKLVTLPSVVMTDESPSATPTSSRPATSLKSDELYRNSASLRLATATDFGITTRNAATASNAETNQLITAVPSGFNSYYRQENTGSFAASTPSSLLCSIAASETLYTPKSASGDFFASLRTPPVRHSLATFPTEVFTQGVQPSRLTHTLRQPSELHGSESLKSPRKIFVRMSRGPSSRRTDDGLEQNTRQEISSRKEM